MVFELLDGSIERRVGPFGRAVLAGYRAAVAGIARAGLDVIVDEVLLSEEDWRGWQVELAGLDVLAHVMRNLEERLPRAEDRAWFVPSPLLQRLLEQGALGEKTGKGFYERRKDASGASVV